MGSTALVADDEESVRKVCARFLRMNGFTVIEASDGLQAWDALLQGEAVSLIVLDAQMPLISGLELCRRLRAHPTLGSLPVLLMSGAADLEASAAAVGASASLRKPFRMDEFLAAVTALLA